MMGGTAPVTLAGGIALGNAEVLSSLVIHQLKRTGAPFVYGTGLHHLDLRTTISVYGAPEFQLARALVADMARFYGLPSWGYSSCSDAHVMDGQAAADAAYQVRDALMMGIHLVHDVGYLEAGLTTSPAMMVFTAEMIDMHRRFMAGVDLSDEALALAVIHDAGPGGDFIATDHTLRHYREDWYPTLFERRRYGQWEADGAKTLEDRLREQDRGHHGVACAGTVAGRCARRNRAHSAQRRTGVPVVTRDRQHLSVTVAPQQDCVTKHNQSPTHPSRTVGAMNEEMP